MNKTIANRKLRNSIYMAWSKAAVMVVSTPSLIPRPVRRQYALAMLSIGTILSGV